LSLTRHGRYVEDPLGEEVSNRGEATVRITPDPLFDCSEVVGKVFNDLNGNGYQDENEAGLAGITLATAKGLLITTDESGKYHITCAAVPNGKIGSNFILKIDERTLPTGFSITSENPRVIRLTRGKMSKMNFGVAKDNLVTLDLSDAAFLPGSTELKPEYQAQMSSLVQALSAEKSTLTLNYQTMGDSRLANARLDELSEIIGTIWETVGSDYDLPIEKKITSSSVPRGAGQAGE